MIVSELLRDGFWTSGASVLHNRTILKRGNRNAHPQTMTTNEHVTS